MFWSCYFSIVPACVWGRLATSGKTIPEWWCIPDMFDASPRSMLQFGLKTTYPKDADFFQLKISSFIWILCVSALRCVSFGVSWTFFIAIHVPEQWKRNLESRCISSWERGASSRPCWFGVRAQVQNHYIPLQSTGTTMQDRVMTCIEQLSKHMFLVPLTRPYSTHVCKDYIMPSQGSLWINQQNVASPGLWSQLTWAPIDMTGPKQQPQRRNCSNRICSATNMSMTVS